MYLCQSEKPCHLNIKTVYAFSPTLKQTRQSTGNREIQKRVAAITQSEAGKDPKSSACAHKVHINIHSELPLTHFLTNTHTHTGVNVCARHTCTSTTLCVSLLTQALQVPLTARAAAEGLTRSAVPSLSLRVTTLPLNQTRTTARTVIKQTSSRSLRHCIFMYNLIGRKQLASSWLPIKFRRPDPSGNVCRPELLCVYLQRGNISSAVLPSLICFGNQHLSYWIE